MNSPLVSAVAADEALLLVLGPVVPDRHQAEAVDEDGRAEAGIDGLDLLGGDDEVDVGQPAAAVRLGEHGEGDAPAAGLLVGGLGHLPAGERIGLGVDLLRERGEHLLREVPRERLDLLLLLGEGEINGHLCCLLAARSLRTADAPRACTVASDEDQKAPSCRPGRDMPLAT